MVHSGILYKFLADAKHLKCRGAWGN